MKSHYNRITVAAFTVSLFTTPLFAAEEAAPAAATATPSTQEAAPAVAKPAATPSMSPTEELSYAIGQNIGHNLKNQEIELNLEMLTKSLQDAYAGKEPLVSTERMAEVLSQFQQDRMAKRMAEQRKVGEKNLQEGEKFLAENKKKEGIVELESGLQYKVITEGTGKTPTAESTVKTHYRGTLIDGTEFDSSYKRNEPATFPVNGVIAGWTEALQLMKEGAKWQLFIPAKLGYGEQGAGGVIQPNSTLIFEIELLSVEK